MKRLTRRRLLLGALSATTLSACGFRLRGAIEMPFSSAFVDGNPNDALISRLRRQLQSNDVTLTDTVAAAQVHIRVLSLRKERDILSLNSAGKAREYRLFYHLAYAVDRGDGTTLRTPDSITIRRDVTFNENQLLAKTEEEAVLYRDMEVDLVRQLMRRLAAIKVDAPARQ